MTDANAPALLLASGSPRRRELLAQLGIPFSVVVSGFDEDSVPTEGLSPAQWTMRLAEGKARAARLPTREGPHPPAPSLHPAAEALRAGAVGTGEGEQINPSYPRPLAGEGGIPMPGEGTRFLVLGADTTVTLDGAYFNKPTDAADARRMLRALSGRTHEVTTGVCVLDTRTQQAQMAADTARVTFAPMTDAEIDAYVATGDPLDKAGAYGVQGGLLPFTPRVDGDFYTVMGLPVTLVRALLLPFYPTL